MVPFRVLCAIRTRLQSCWWFCCPWLLSNYLLRRHQVAINMTWLQDGRTFVVKCETHPPLWQTCKVLCTWALFRETTVYVYREGGISNQKKKLEPFPCSISPSGGVTNVHKEENLPAGQRMHAQNVFFWMGPSLLPPSLSAWVDIDVIW